MVAIPGAKAQRERAFRAHILLSCATLFSTAVKQGDAAEV